MRNLTDATTITFHRASPPHTTLNSFNMAPKVKDASKKPAKKTAGPAASPPFMRALRCSRCAQPAPSRFRQSRCLS